MEVSDKLHASDALPQCPLNTKWLWFQNWSGCVQERINLVPLSGMESQFPKCPAPRLVTILTTVLLCDVKGHHC
jgi:hypothetical protein